MIQAMVPSDVSMRDLDPELQRALILASPLAWGNYALGDWVTPYEHLRYVESKLVRLNPHHEATALHGEIKRLRVSQPPQTGKQCADSTLVLTAQGWRRHGELVPGDRVIGPDGKWKRVLAVSPPSVASLVVEMTDGSKVKCHPNHEWTVYDRFSSSWRNLETRKLMGYRLRSGPEGRGGRYRFQLPLLEPVEGYARDLPIPPYSFGAWLGDGTLGKALITGADSDYQIIQAMAREEVVPTSHFVHRETGVLSHSFGGGWYSKFCEFSRKRIPAIYLTASIEQRLELLAGLIDTDGVIHRSKFRKCNRVSFSSAEKRLAQDVATLVRTFGWRASIAREGPRTSSSGIVGKRPTWTVSFSPDREIGCRLARKQGTDFFVQRRRIAVKSIEPAPPERGRCIQVEGGIYCVGRHLTPTHNSVLVSTCFPTWLLLNDPTLRIMLISYGDRRAHELGLQTKNMFDYGAPLFGLEVDKSTRAKEFWRVKDHGGYILSSGIGGPVNGMPADVVIFDDPYRGPDEALSPTGRNRVERFATSVLQARLAKNGKMVLVHTRWHPQDLIGASEAWERDSRTPWHTVLLQALPEEDRYDEETGDLIQKADESICEDLKPKEFLEEVRATNTDYEWYSLWQNTPVGADGTLWSGDAHFNSEVFIDAMPENPDLLAVSIDPAMGEQMAKGDYTAICAAATNRDGLFYLDFDLSINGPDESLDRLVNFILKLPRKPDVIGFESIGFQRLFKDKGTEKLLEAKIHCPIVGLKPTMRNQLTGKDVQVNKQARIATTLDGLIRKKKYRFVRGRGTSICIGQLESFPMKHYHDDGPDAMEMAMRLLRDAAAVKRRHARISRR